MKFSSLMAGAAAAGLLMAPLAAQAGTKASAAVAAPSDFGIRSSATVAKKNNIDSAILILALIGAGAGGYGLYKAIDDGDSSRGS